MKNNRIRNIAILCLILFLIVFLIYFTTSNHYIKLTQLHNNSYKQMMGYFIKTNNNKIIVVDGGNPEDSENLKKYINNNGGKVDYWFLTHFHSDHTGAISDIINNSNIEIKTIIYHECERKMVEKYEPSRLEQYEQIHNSLQNEKIKDKIIDPKEGQIFDIDTSVEMKIISTFENDITENFGNNTSTVYKLNANNKSILFLGDTGKERSEKLLLLHRDELKSDYVQMSHHGQNGATFELYKEIDPDFCLWPTPDWLWNNDEGNGYNTSIYKTIETREWMKRLNIKKHYIEKDGDITIKI